MEILLVRGEIRPGSRDAFLETSAVYNSARAASGLPKYRRLVETGDGGDGAIVFICEFADVAEMERADVAVEIGHGVEGTHRRDVRASRAGVCDRDDLA